MLRRPIFLQLRRDHLAQGGVAAELAPLGTPPAVPGAAVGFGSAITAAAAEAVELACDRRGSTAKAPSDCSSRLAGRDTARDLLPLGQHQRQPATPPLAWRDAAVFLDRAMDGAGCSVERPADLADRLATLPALPQLAPKYGVD